jgi:hypothetical protein
VLDLREELLVPFLVKEVARQWRQFTLADETPKQLFSRLHFGSEILGLAPVSSSSFLYTVTAGW